VTHQLPHDWPGNKAIRVATTALRLHPETAAFAVMFNRMSWTKKKKHYTAFRNYFNTFNTKEVKDNG
jgi:hypothetical protein